MARTITISMLLMAAMWAISAALARSTGKILRIYADKNSNVHVVLQGAKEAVVPHRQDQSGIDDVKIADDGRIAGWLVLYPNPANDATTKFDDISWPLVIWRDGKIVRTFDSGPAFWSWAFLHGGVQVAYHTGPMHEGPSSHCELRDVNTGRLLATWDATSKILIARSGPKNWLTRRTQFGHLPKSQARERR